MDIVLTPVEARVLGSLLEKELTVPATYPLTMKVLVSACNQTSSRDPLMDLGDAEVEAAVDGLKAHRLVRKLLPSHGNRSVKFRQVAVEVLTVDEAQRAILTVLLLRGPQTPQELKTRTDRLHAFADVDEVEDVLADMARWGEPLVRLLPRRPGQRDARWAHLLSGEPDLSASEPAPAARPVAAAPAAPAP
ncbi:MAG TPA: YceH family protein, partial [Iamia sp.]